MTQAAIPAPPRPGTVTVAFVLQLALVGMLALMACLAVAEAVHYDRLIDEAARFTGADPVEVSTERGGNVFDATVTAVPALLVAVWLGVAAPWVRQGSNVARVLTLVGVAAPVLLSLLACLFGGLIAVLIAGLLLASDDPAAFEDEEFTLEEESAFFRALEELDGASIAYQVLGVATTLLAVMLAVAVFVLLLTKASGRYFRPPAPPWHGPAAWLPPQR